MFFGEPFGGVIPGARGAVLSVLLRTGSPLTGRQVHGLISDDYSLWTVQEALKALTRLGIVETQSVGRAGVHSINEEHVAVGALRAIVDPIAALREVVGTATGTEVTSVILFGSIARGEAAVDSDVDLAVIAPRGWDKRVELEDSVRTRVGNACDVLVFTQAEFGRLASSGEPVVRDILREGIALVGTVPRIKLAVV